MAAMTRRRVQAGLLLMLAASVLLHAWAIATPGFLDRAGNMKCPDFLQFYTYGALARTGQSSQLYSGDAHARIARTEIDPRVVLTGLRPNYSPVIAWLMAPLSALPYLRAMATWAVLSVLLYAVSVGLVMRLASWLPGEARLVWLAAAAWPTLFELLRYGQLSALSLLVLSAATFLAWQGRSVAAGVMLGCLVYKPNLLVAPGLIFLLAGEWPLVWGLLLGAAIETLVAVASVGPTVFGEYLQVLIALVRRPELMEMVGTEQHSVSGAVRLLLPWPALSSVLGPAAIVLSVWAGVRVWKGTRDRRLRWAALVLAALLSSPHLLSYDLLLLAVPILLMLDWKRDSSGRWPEGAWLAVLLMLYGGAWPGTLFARLYHIQISTIGMSLGLALLFQESQHQLVGSQPKHHVVDRATA
jgi:alpha-1,2-mannosyltransferase